jgi:hypothetical protein
MIPKNDLPKTFVRYSSGADIYLPALAGEMPRGEDMKTAAQAYVKDMNEDGGRALVAAHVAAWTKFAAALAIAAAENSPRA